MEEVTQKDIERGARWRQSRREIGITQTEFAEKISNLTITNRNRKVSQQAITLVENGITRNPWLLREAAKVLNKSPAWLQFGNEAIDNIDEDTLNAAITLQNLPPELRKALIETIKSASKSDKNQN